MIITTLFTEGDTWQLEIAKPVALYNNPQHRNKQ